MDLKDLRYDWKQPISTDEMIRLTSVSSSRDVLYARQRLIELRDEIERLTAENKRLLTAMEYDIAEAKNTCGGDGQGCETYRKFYDSPERRWQKCGNCPMDGTHYIREALAARRDENE